MTSAAAVITILAVMAIRTGLAADDKIFPEGFSFGTATASYQVEGAWNEDGRTISIWDKYIHTDPNRINNTDNADVACDSYHKWNEDVAIAASLKLSHYRLSISWTRVLPTGFNNTINLQGLLYYQNLIEQLEHHNITPMVTLYHWDLPQSLQDLGGWTNNDIVDWFRDYADIIFSALPSVKYWITINEPRPVCSLGYGYGSKAPGISESGLSDYKCAYNVIRAHAAAYHLYKEKYAALGGKLSMAIDGTWTQPASDSEEDKAAVERRLAFEFGIYANPIFHGDWPEIVQDRVKERSDKENFTTSRLPQFTSKEKEFINNTADFFGLNYYTIKNVSDIPEASYDTFSYDNDMRVEVIIDPAWKLDVHSNAYAPFGIREYLKLIKDTYDDPEIVITENGIADDGSLDDDVRITFLTDYLTEVWNAINEDNVTVTHYTFWSIMDNFEWNAGYGHHFGLYQVDFTDPKRTRTPKKSASFYRQIIEKNGLVNSGISHAISPLLIVSTLFVYIRWNL